MPTLYWLLVVLHVLTAAAYFGLGLPLARQARAFADSRALALGEQGARTTRLMTVFAALTFVFGLTAMFVGGGFGAYPSQYHTSMLLVLILLGVHFFLVQRGWDGLRAAVGGTGNASGAAKRVAMGVGIAHLIWLVVIVMMFWGKHGGRMVSA